MNKPKPSPKRHRLIKTILAAVLGIGILFGAFVVYIFQTVKPYPINLDEVNLELSGSANASPSSGDSTEAIADLIGNKSRVWVNLKDVPKNLTNAIVSIEDKSFYTNNGINYFRTLGAAINEIIQYNADAGGGSTITQQVIKNLEGNINDRTYKIKLKEIITALDVVKRYSKDQIMETYVNIVTLGNNCYGVQAASKLYFGKDVKELDLAECATLACILPSPNVLYNPYKNPENVHKRRELVLKNMLDQGLVSKEQYDEALNETVTYVRPE